MGPQERGYPFRTEDFLRREIQQNRAEERLGDAHTTEDEVLPPGLEARWRAVQRDQQHGGQRRRLHGDPQKPHVVGREGNQHRRHEELIHAVIKAQSPRTDASVIHLYAHVWAREE